MLLEPLYKNASDRREKLAVADEKLALSFGQLASLSTALAGLIRASTQKPTVGIVLPSCSLFSGAFYGALLAGKTPVPINFLLSPAQVAHIIHDAQLDLILSVAPLVERFQFPNIKTIDLLSLPRPSVPIPLPPMPSIDSKQTAAILYTSATTGMPKGVPLTHENLTTCVEGCIEQVFRGGQHSFLGMVPLFHSLGLTATLCTPMRLAMPVIYQARFSPVTTLQTLREKKPTIVIGIPSMFKAMLLSKSASPDDFTSIYAAVCGGEALPSSVREAFGNRFNVRLMEGYGLTETCGPIAVNTPEKYLAGSVGRLLPGAIARVVNDEEQPVNTNVEGHILLGGPMVIDHYHNLPEADRAAFTDGYFRSGDLGHLDENGFLFITGRSKELIIIGGEKLHPREVEELLLEHPTVADVAVIGRKDESRGEAVIAFVVLRENETLDANKLREFLRERGLPGWKSPREIIAIDDMPRSPTGKILRRELANR